MGQLSNSEYHMLQYLCFTAANVVLETQNMFLQSFYKLIAVCCNKKRKQIISMVYIPIFKFSSLFR